MPRRDAVTAPKRGMGMEVLKPQEIDTDTAMVVLGAVDTEAEIEAAAARNYSKRFGEEIEDGAGSDSSEAKRQRDDGDEEEPDPNGYRQLFEIFWSSLGCKFDDITRGPMSHTDDVEPRNCSGIYPCLEIYWCRVSDLKGLEWPIRVFGLVAVHDSLDRKRNYIFNRERNDAQELDAEVSFLVLTGPMRAINCHQRIEFEVDLKVRGKRQSEDKVLSSQFFVYDPVAPGCRIDEVLTESSSDKHCAIEVKFGHFAQAVEATIELKVVQGLSDFRGTFVARTEGFNEEVMLLDSGHDLVPVADGVIRLNRKVVVVEATGVLRLHVIARKGYGETAGVAVAEDSAKFIAQTSKTSSEPLDVGFCKMVATIYWSRIPFV